MAVRWVEAWGGTVTEKMRCARESWGEVEMGIRDEGATKGVEVWSGWLMELIDVGTQIQLCKDPMEWGERWVGITRQATALLGLHESERCDDEGPGGLGLRKGGAQEGRGEEGHATAGTKRAMVAGAGSDEESSGDEAVGERRGRPRRRGSGATRRAGAALARSCLTVPNDLTL